MSLVESDTGTLERLGVTVSRTGLSLPLELDYSGYERVCGFIGAMHDATNWWIADAFIQGERLFGDDVYQAAELLHCSPHTIQNVITVGRKVPPSRRRENVDFSHHAEVTKLEPDEQKYWLRVAEEERLTRSELRARIKADGNVLPPDRPVCEACGRPL